MIPISESFRYDRDLELRCYKAIGKENWIPKPIQHEMFEVWIWEIQTVYGIGVTRQKDYSWAATINGSQQYTAYRPLEAVMKCYVAHKLGDEVEIPEELME